MKKLIPLKLAFVLCILVSCSQEKKLLRKANIATDRMEYEKAIAYYDQAIELNGNSYRANVGKGIVLAEFMERYAEAIPYLEKALNHSPEDTLPKINYDLGKSYHHLNNYQRALYYYYKVVPYNKANNPDFDIFLSKRIADCKYALTHNTTAPADEQLVVNVGRPVNTDMPEYSPVFINGELLFTSKLKDNANEKKNEWDGKYFESMYVSTFNKKEFSEPRKYTLPDMNSKKKYAKYNEAVVSVTPDRKKLFVFRDGKIYESDMSKPVKDLDKLSNTINFARFQNHACLSEDGKQLFFTGESKKGIGGIDIYRVVKEGNGEWSTPELLDSTVNTPFDESSPFLSKDGTLFFSSNGHPGYGGYDVYKTRFENGRWSTPENLGQPVNSSADDIFFSLNANSSNGYYSSSRTGGYGDMDIYQVHYLSTEIPDCKSPDDLLVINSNPYESNNLNYHLSLEIPKEYVNNVKSYQWQINDSVLTQTSGQIEYTFTEPGTHTVSVKALIYCDTCPSLIALCNEKIITATDNIQADTQIINSNSPYLSDEELKVLNWNASFVYFDYDKAELSDEALKVLNDNISVMKNNKNLSVIINGYTDSRGTEAYNMQLSAKRIAAVKRYFIQKGISGRRIKNVYALGETKLFNNCTDNVECDEQQHQLNRRVEFKVLNELNKPLLTISSSK